MAFRARHLLGIEHLAPLEITTVLDLADRYVEMLSLIHISEPTRPY